MRIVCSLVGNIISTYSYEYTIRSSMVFLALKKLRNKQIKTIWKI